MEIQRDGRYWAIYDEGGILVCLTVYKKGAAEVVRRLAAVQATTISPGDVGPNDTASVVEPTTPQTKPKKQTRRPRRRSQHMYAALPMAADMVAEDRGHGRRLGTITIHIDVTCAGED